MVPLSLITVGDEDIFLAVAVLVVVFVVQILDAVNEAIRRNTTGRYNNKFGGFVCKYNAVVPVVVVRTSTDNAATAVM